MNPRQAAAAAYGVDVGAFTDDAKKDTVCPEWGTTYRQMLLNLGVPATLLGGDHDHWVKRWRIEVAKLEADQAEDTAQQTYRDARIYRIYEGTTQILQLQIAKHMLREWAADQG